MCLWAEIQCRQTVGRALPTPFSIDYNSVHENVLAFLSSKNRLVGRAKDRDNDCEQEYITLKLFEWDGGAGRERECSRRRERKRVSQNIILKWDGR